MKKNRISIRFLAIIMAFMVAFVTMPVQAIALGLEEIGKMGATATDNSLIETGDGEQDVFIVEEDRTKRGQFEKHYLCSDGTFISVTYPEAIHYLDDNNQWQDVDQSLTYDSASGMYISDKADFVVSFSNNVSSTNIASIERNGYALSWGIQTTKKNGNDMSISAYGQSNVSANSDAELVVTPASAATAQVVESVEAISGNISDRSVSDKNSFELPKISSQICYESIIGGTQNIALKYTVYHNKIEEDIIISERGDLQSVSMNMDIGPLTPVVNDDGSVDLVDANNVMQFHIGIPYMVDAEHSVCNDIQVTAVKDGTSCIITYTPNAEWFESAERVFPILLDPSVTTNDYVSNIEDTYVEQNSTANHSSEQFLYFTPTSDNGNRRNIIVRVTQLPKIDASMPIISASLTLTAQYAPFSDVGLKAGYLDRQIELDEYNYATTVNDNVAFTAYGYLNTGSTRVIFDFTSHIYDMYSDLARDMEEGHNYHGDFVIGYASSTDTTFSYPFFSSNYATPANRPVFTVKYGYTLPAGMLNGNIYSFRNSGSYSYMSVNGTSPAENSNIYQVSHVDDLATKTQKFKLEYVSETGGYLLRSMRSSSGTGMVISINREGNDLDTNMNVRLSSATDSIAQEWLIVPVDYDVFRIVPRANMSLGLTVYGYDNGTNAGTSSNSLGNIFVQTITSGNNYQKWYIYDNSDNKVNTSLYRADIESGNYFIGNSFTGRYLHRNGNIVNGMSGRITSLGEETVKWQIVNLGDGYCTIQRSDTPHYYLAPTGTTSGSGVKVYSSVSETIPDNYKWSIRTVSGGGCVIEHKTSGFYLTGISSTANPSSVYIYGLNTPETDAYKKQVWRVANENYYDELDDAFTFNDLALNINKNETKLPSINKSPSSASWASYTDFDYTITSGAEQIIYNSTTKKFTGQKTGSASITAVHKTTGITDSFTIVVYRPAVVLIHGRTDNSFTLWGANTHVAVNPLNPDEKGNNHYNSSLDATTIGSFIGQYKLRTTQEIFGYCYDGELYVPAVFNGQFTGDNAKPYLEEHPEGGNLAYQLKRNGYTINVDLFVFNYPNEDAVVHSANKLDAYLADLASYIRTSGSAQAKLSFFGVASGITSTSPYCIDIVGHSMGGLVARYYIENLGKDENIRKLVTIGTPHWGSTLANISNIAGVFNAHHLCDHDLTTNSAMNGGNNEIELDTCWLGCDRPYMLTEELNYDTERLTKYYAIAGIDLPLSSLNKNDKGVDINPYYTTLTEVSNTLVNAHSSFNIINIYLESDNVVGFLSQIGCVGSQISGIEKKIEFEKIFVNIDTDDGNSVSIDNHYHGKMPHRQIVMDKVLEYLYEQ